MFNSEFSIILPSVICKKLLVHPVSQLCLCAEEPLVKAAKVTRTTSNEASKPVRTVSIITEDPVDVGQKSPSPARRPASNVVHVTGLVRPFTVGQLKELLGRTGTLADDGFWIDNIKSHCYAVVCTVHCVCLRNV